MSSDKGMVVGILHHCRSLYLVHCLVGSLQHCVVAGGIEGVLYVLVQGRVPLAYNRSGSVYVR